MRHCPSLTADSAALGKKFNVTNQTYLVYNFSPYSLNISIDKTVGKDLLNMQYIRFLLKNVDFLPFIFQLGMRPLFYFHH